MIVRIGKIQKIVLAAFVIRLIMLAVVFVVTPDWSAGFLGNSVTQDDVRYEMGAIHYAHSASSLIDPNAFMAAYASYGDYVGYVGNLFTATPLWYWIVCFVYYVFRSVIPVRILNIVFSTLSVSMLYKLVNLYYGDETATTAARLLAFLPYPIIFACFSYKDNLVMLLTISLFYYALNFRRNNKICLKYMTRAIVVALLLLLIRGGLSAILIVFCLLIAFFTGEKLEIKRFIKRFILVALSIATAVYIISNSWSSIEPRLQSYITGRDMTNLGGISLVTITKFSDLYKLPLTFLFAILMPLVFTGKLTSWYGIVGILNICMAPISIGATIDIFLHKKREWMFIGCCLAYYIISIVASIGIFRHYFSLIFIPIMFFSHFKYKGNIITKNVWKIGSFGYGMILLIYLFL